MNKYVFMLVAAGLIAAAPAYYAFQAQAEEAQVSEESAAPATEQTAEESIVPADDSQPAVEPAAGEEAMPEAPPAE